jgi:hypothetical protein
MSLLFFKDAQLRAISRDLICRNRLEREAKNNLQFESGMIKSYLLVPVG